MNFKNLYTVSQYAEMFNLSRPTVYAYIKDGKLKTVTISGRRFIRVPDPELAEIIKS